MQTAGGARAALATARPPKDFQLWRHPFPMHLTSTFSASLIIMKWKKLVQKDPGV